MSKNKVYKHIKEQTTIPSSIFEILSLDIVGPLRKPGNEICFKFVTPTRRTDYSPTYQKQRSKNSSKNTKTLKFYNHINVLNLQMK